MTNFKIKDMKNKNMKQNPKQTLHFPPSKGDSWCPNKTKTEGEQDLEHGAKVGLEQGAMAEQAEQGAMAEQALVRPAWREQALERQA